MNSSDSRFHWLTSPSVIKIHHSRHLVKKNNKQNLSFYSLDIHDIILGKHKEFGFVSGWGQDSSIEGADDYEILPLALRFGFDASGEFLKVESPHRLEFLVEPFINPVLGPDSNVEVGCGLLLKYAHSINSYFSPYIEAGTGAVYSTQDVVGQSTRWNFLTQCGFGLHYFFREATSLNIGYRFRHSSNAGIEEPNSGIDVHSFIMGFSYFY